MRAIVFLLALITVSIQAGDDSEEWNKYKLQYGKSYRSPVENSRRYAIFQENLKKITEHNILYKDGKSSHMEGINQFTDWTSKEFLSYINRGFTVGPNIWGKTFTKAKDFKAPNSIDWRNKSAVTGVKNQDMCGSSWAFSATGAIEGQLGLKGNLLSLSEQNLIDCLTDSGCNGGSINKAFDYVKKNGIESEVSYPYIAAEGSCVADSSSIVTKISNFVKIPPNDEEALKKAIAIAGPISVAIDATEKLQRYSGGILDDDICRNDTRNHGVLIVGYGMEDKGEFYIIKNSWGNVWGEKGYFKLPRNKNNKCAVASLASYPVL